MSPFTHLRWLALPALAISLATLASCGGGGSGGPAPGPTPQTLTLGSEAARDGHVQNGGAAVAVADAASPSVTGDNGLMTPASRQFYSFDLSTLPAGATVQSATLRIPQEGSAGTPFATHGVVIVDHLAYDLLDPSDFDMAPLAADIGTLATTSAFAVRTLVVTAQVLADIAAARTRTQYRLRWSIQDDDGDANVDFVRFTDAEDIFLSGGTPELVIVYTLP